MHFEFADQIKAFESNLLCGLEEKNPLHNLT